MIATFCLSDIHEVDSIIYKPSLHNLGKRVGENWYVVRDFSTSIQNNIAAAKKQPYSFRYAGVVPTKFSIKIIYNSIIRVCASNDMYGYHLLSVALYETMCFFFFK